MQRITTFTSLAEVPSTTLNGMQDGAAPVNPLVGWRLGGDLRAPGDGNIYIAPRRIILNANGVDTLIQTGETSFTPTTSASLWYYVYSTISGTTETIEYTSGAAPDNALIYRSAVSSRRYLGCFRTTGANVILPFRCTRGKYLYRFSKLALSNFTALSSTGAASYTDLSLTSWVPPHARIAQLRLLLNARTTASALSIRTKGDSTADSFTVLGTNTGTAAAHQVVEPVEIETDASQAIQYVCVNSGSGVAETASIYVTGFTDQAN
jgi:hypothetical protein